MRSGRLIATMAVAFVIVPALYADDGANSTTTAKDDDSASVAAPAVPAGTRPDTAEPLPVRSSISSQSQSGAFAEPVAATRGWDDSEEYPPTVEWFLGYSFWRAMPSFNNRMGYLHGGSTSVAYNFNRYVGLVADFGGYDNSRVTLFAPTASETFHSNGSAYTYLFGPRFSFRYERFTPFFHALFGGAHASSVMISGCTGTPICAPLGSDDAFATMVGAGLDLNINHHFALRLFQGDFLITHFRNPLSSSGERGWQNNGRFSTGVVFRFGGSPSLPKTSSVGL
jgi:hypothetical protein